MREATVGLFTHFQILFEETAEFAAFEIVLPLSGASRFRDGQLPSLVESEDFPAEANTRSPHIGLLCSFTYGHMIS